MLVRGNYYREHSTRVLQPQVVFTKSLPKLPVQLQVDYLLDAISSASVAAGAAALGGDKVFHEWRHDSGVSLRVAPGPWQLQVSGRYSTETDYQSTGGVVQVGRDLWHRNIQVLASYALSMSRAYRVRNNVGDRSPWLSTGTTNKLWRHGLTLAWTQVLSPRALLGLTAQGSDLRGPQDNPYRRARNGQPERHPLHRRRGSLTLWSRAKVGRRVILGPWYRLYGDSWGILAHTFDARVYLDLTRYLRLRLRYRVYHQRGADFWRKDGNYAPTARYITDDPKASRFWGQTPGISLHYRLDGIAHALNQGWLEQAWIQATYNHVFQTTRFSDARLGSLAFSLAY